VQRELAAVAHADLESLAEHDEQRQRRREQAAAGAPPDRCYEQLEEAGEGDGEAERLVDPQGATGSVQVDAREDRLQADRDRMGRGDQPEDGEGLHVDRQ
jgi:hypothetical protein